MTGKRSTDDLIRDLASRPAPPAFRPEFALGGMALALATGLVIFFLVFGMRADLGAAWTTTTVQAKSVLPLALAVLAIVAALQSGSPAIGARLWPLALPALLAAGLLAYRAAGADGSIFVETIGNTALACLMSIIALSALPLCLGILAFRRSAPIQPRLTGALIGLASGAAGAAGYALHCTEDSPLFFVTWYGLAIGVMAVSGAGLGGRALRW